MAEGLQPWSVAELYVMGPGSAGNQAVHVDITDAIDKKVEALRVHASQTRAMADLDERIRGWGVRVAQAAGFPEGRLAESFRRVDTR